MKINLLEPRVFNRISAGEVVEKPASIVKELVENSIDAGASKIVVEIENGGIKSIIITDNGCGIEKDDMKNAFMPHATSKIKSIEDLDSIASLGFRGEALASIASVCHVSMTSKVEDSDIGYSIKIDGGSFSPLQEVARSNGTTITCQDLFYNTPARAKFLKKPKSEESEITHLIQKFMLSHSEIAFTYYVDGKMVYNTTPCGMQDIIYTIYGREVYENLIEVDHQEDGYQLKGFITKPKLSKSNRTYQTLFVNGRYVENYLVSSAVQGVYESFLMKGKFPIYVLNLILPTDCVDVNVHPSKREVKFENSNKIFGLVRRAVEKALLSVGQIANFLAEEDEPLPNQNSEYNMEGFSPLYKKNDEPLSQSQGRSYVSIDLVDTKEPLPFLSKNQHEPETEKAPPKPRPDFEGMKLEEREVPINRKGGPLFFDNDNEIYRKEIINNKTLIQNKRENEKILEESFISADIDSEMKILGTVFKTYIVIEHEDAIYFIDQHAGHERLLYDKLVKATNESKAYKQPLMIPFRFKVSAKEYNNVTEIIPHLKSLGFDIKEEDNYSFEIGATPLALGELKLDKFIQEVLAETPLYKNKASDFINDKLCQHACKHAIKAGDNITKEECAYLIGEIRKGVMLCPHGRPVTLVITKKEFEKIFKRIV